MKFIDSHSHLYLPEFSEDLPQVIERARTAGVSHILLPNIDSTTISGMLDVCKTYPDYCFPMIGLHPTSVNKSFERELDIVKSNLEEDPARFIAIGEVGIDLYWDRTFIEQQLKAFDNQIKLALDYDLPLVIHTRDAFREVYDSLLPYKNTSLSGVFHSFTGTLEEALSLLEFDNFMIGINGVVTFKNSTLSDVLRHVPLERILLETDAPYLTPVPNRGKRNESANLKDTLFKVAAIYAKTPEEVAQATTTNAIKVFSMLK